MKLKRLVSAILAVGMALTMLPTAAFAADTSKYVTDLNFEANGQPVLEGKTTEVSNSSSPANPTYKATNSTWSWSYSGGSYKLDFVNNTIFNPINGSPETVPCAVRNSGTIEGGNFEQTVFNLSTGVIKGGHFTKVEGRTTYNSNGQPTGSGIVTGGYIHTYFSNEGQWGGAGAKLNGGIVYGKVDMQEGILQSGIVCNIPDSSKVQVSNYQTFTAEGGKIIPVVAGDIVPTDVQFNGKVYIVGNENIMTRKFTVEPASPTFVKWDLSEDGNATIIEDPTTHVLTVTLPENSTSAGDVTIKAVVEPVDLEVGIVDGEKVPVYEGKFYEGSDLDGWFFDRKNETLTVYKNGSVDLGNAEVDWAVDNFGKIEGGIFDYKDDLKDVLTNEEGGVIDGGTFNVKVRNYGTIENGTFNNTVYNNNITNGGVFVGRFANTPTQVTLPDTSIAITARGTTNGGIFSRGANFDTQDVKVSWITLNNCTANGISGMVGVVGNQTLNVEADATSWTGWEVTADPSYEEAITKQVGNTTAFDLTLNGDDEWSVTLTAQVKEGYYRMSLTDGTATNADGTEITSAKAGDTVKLTAADAPEGMVFDRWEISPADVALTLEEGGFDSHAATASFKMPAQTLSIRAMYRMADQPEEPNVLGTVAMVATAGVGAAVVGYTGYMIGTELYLNTVLPDGVAIPQNTAELAKLVWTEAGKPAPAAVMAPDATDEQKALTWAIENQLISADKAADASVSRWEVIQTWNKAQEMKG